MSQGGATPPRPDDHGTPYQELMRRLLNVRGAAPKSEAPSSTLILP